MFKYELLTIKSQADERISDLCPELFHYMWLHGCHLLWSNEGRGTDSDPIGSVFRVSLENLFDISKYGYISKYSNKWHNYFSVLSRSVVFMVRPKYKKIQKCVCYDTAATKQQLFNRWASTIFAVELTLTLNTCQWAPALVVKLL